MRAQPFALGDICDGLNLCLRPICKEHADFCHAACQDTEIRRWLPLPWPYTKELALEWCRSGAEEFRVSCLGIHYAIMLDNDLAGCISYKHPRWKEEVIEIGYWLAPSMRGRGCATRAVSVLAQHAFELGFHRVEMRVAPENTKSVAVALRAGFCWEGTMRLAGITATGRTDLDLYSRLAHYSPEGRRESQFGWAARNASRVDVSGAITSAPPS